MRTWIQGVGLVRQELEGLEAELGAAVQAGQADAFVHYLHGLVLSDRRGPASRPPVARQAQQHLQPCLFLQEVLRVMSGSGSTRAWPQAGFWFAAPLEDL